MPSLIDLHGTAMGEFDRRVRAVGPADWAHPTPCDAWDVHDLVNHLTAEQLWVPHLLNGARIEDVGGRFDGDNLGDEPAASWAVASRDARATWLGTPLEDTTVHLSFGDTSAVVYLWEMTFDLAVHAWDLARGLGAPEHLDPELVDELLAWASDKTLGPGPYFHAPVDIGPGAEPQERLLAFSGRRP